MTAPASDSDDRFERFLGTLLRIGVLTSATVVLVGGIVYLSRHATEPIDYSKFEEDRDLALRSPRRIVTQALAPRGRGIIQLGLLLLIATPVARVVFSVVGFARQRDYTYVVLTLVVLAVLLYSLFLEGP
jgi:uncharacterized membrane protein